MASDSLSSADRETRLLSDPQHRETVRRVLRRALAIARPTEAGVAEAILDSLLDQAARGELLDPGVTPREGGFGGIELELWLLLPLVIDALARLVRELGRNWPGEVAAGRPIPRANDVATEPGVEERLRAIEEAIRQCAAAMVQPMPTIRDFSIRIESVAGGYRARVLPSSGGSAEVAFSMPSSFIDLQTALRRLERGVRVLDSLDQYDPDRIARDPCVFGGELHDALFAGGVRDAWRECRAVARRNHDILRIRLVLNPKDRALCALPWELLYDRQTGRYLGHEPQTSIVRHLALDVPTEPSLAPIQEKLRVLVVSAVPRSRPALDTEEEAARIEQSLRESGRFQVERIHQATLRDLRSALAKHSPHVLHFIGHGSYASRNEAAIDLIGPDGWADPVTGHELAIFLLGCEERRLVILNSCNGASLLRREGLDAFSAMAPALIRGGLPAVIAMQFPITDRAAVDFSTAFYGSVGDDRSVESALSAARTSLFELERKRGSCEWATPVLYLGVDSGDLLRAANP